MVRYTILQFLVLFGCLFIIGQSRNVSHIDADDDADADVGDIDANDDADVDDIDTDDIDIDFYSNKDDSLDRLKKPFTLTEIFIRLYHAFGFNGTWVSDKDIMVTDFFTGNIIKYDVATGDKKMIFDGSDLPLSYKFGTAQMSFDERYILFGYNMSQEFRHSFIKNYVIYDTRSGTFEKMANEALLSLAEWSPVGNDLVYVRDNDIYHTILGTSANVVRRLTDNGRPGIVYNGVADWVYEEEVLASATALWYSPDGRHLAFATFNDTVVKDMAYFHYGDPGSLHDQYPTEVKIKYPKPGTPNPMVSLSVIDLSDPSSEAVALKPPVHVVGSDNILFAVSWWNETHLTATWTNRVQNTSQLVMYDTQGVESAILYDEETEGWLQPNAPIRSGPYALLLRRQHSGTDAGKFRHITRYEYEDGQLTSPVDLTPGPSEVHSILAVDSYRDKVYYLATAPGEPTQKNLYWVPLDASQNPTCISCEVLTPEGNRCAYATASFSRGRSYYAFTCSGPDPNVVTINNERHEPILIWTSNRAIRKLLSRRLMPLQKDFNVTVNGYDSRVRLFLPPNFNATKSYPLLVYVYGGPNTVRITDTAKFEYEYYMSTNRRVIYAWIDARGSAFKGSKMLFEMYRNLGTVEVEDTIAITAMLQKRYSWIDPNRTGIWGWSYGGFTTGMVLATDTASVFKCGISVAPVTSWIYYDSIYTERYMGLPIPDDNLAGYNRTDITRRVDGIRGKKYMLIHGSEDDNVHYQQAMALAKSLERQDILFEQVTYTDEAHALERVSPHFFHTMDKFWNECFHWDRTH